MELWDPVLQLDPKSSTLVARGFRITDFYAYHPKPSKPGALRPPPNLLF